MTVPPPVFPTPHTVGHRTWSASGTKNDWGDVTPGWSDPVAKKVYGWRLVSSEEPSTAGHDRVVSDTKLAVPPGFVCAPQDRIILHFDAATWSEEAGIPEHEVVGDMQSADANPFDWNPGGVIDLRRVTG